VIQNARFRRPVILPELRDLSLRQAETTIKTLGLNIQEVVYEPSTFKNILLDIRVGDTSVVAGTRLEEGDYLTLVVGKGQGIKEVTVPYIVGKSIDEARSWLLANSLTLGSVEYDIEPTEETKNSYIIYQQEPTSGIVVVEGTSVSIKLSTSIEKAISTGEEETSEEDFW
jgi:beta-lactam-binding protein with PASTA domain